MTIICEFVKPYTLKCISGMINNKPKHNSENMDIINTYNNSDLNTVRLKAIRPSDHTITS